MKKWLWIVAMVAALVCVPEAAKKATLRPFYLCEGKNLDGRTYQVALQTGVVEGGALHLLWTSASGARLLGLGILDGDRLVVGLLVPDVLFGVATYTVKDTMLEGRWTTTQGPVVQSEVCKAANPDEWKPPSAAPVRPHVGPNTNLQV